MTETTTAEAQQSSAESTTDLAVVLYRGEPHVLVDLVRHHHQLAHLEDALDAESLYLDWERATAHGDGLTMVPFCGGCQVSDTVDADGAAVRITRHTYVTVDGLPVVHAEDKR